MSTANSTADIRQVLRATLIADALVSSYVSDRVYGAHLQDPDAQTVGYPLIIVEITGGDLIRTGRLNDLSMALWAYSRTSLADAEEIYRSCTVILHAERLTVTGISVNVIPTETGRPTDGWNENTRAHYVVGRWRVQATG